MAEFDKIGLQDFYGGQTGETANTFTRRSRLDPRNTTTLYRPLPYIDVRAYGATGDGITDDTAAIQAAIDAATLNSLPFFLPNGMFLVTSNLVSSGPFDWSGSGVGKSILDYTGASPMLKFSAVANSMHWRDFEIRTTGNANANVDVIDLREGSSYSLFECIKMDLTSVARHGWILSGVGDDLSANNSQYLNTWQNCIVRGNSGYCWYLYSTDIANSRCNYNAFTNCVTGISCDVAYYVQGAGNNWFSGEIGANAGTYSVVIDSDVAAFNGFYNILWDGTNKPVQFQVDTATTKSPPAIFFNCGGSIYYSYASPYDTNLCKIHDYEGDGITQVSPGRIAIWDPRYFVIDMGLINNIDFQVSPDRYLRMRTGALAVDEGAIYLGSTQDVKIYRSAANVLKTDDTLAYAAYGTVASGSTITLGAGNVFLITGTTNIDSIHTDDTINGREVKFIFNNALTVNDNTGNLKLAGNFAADGTTNNYDTLCLICDGSSWFEISRSAN